MTTKEFKTILEYINVLIDQATASNDTDNVVEALDQIQDLIKLHINLLEEE